MIVDLVQATTSDGWRLDGCLQTTDATPRLGVSAVCLVHGTGGNFYGSTLFDALAERLLSLGCSVLRVNTRGHDGISTSVTAEGGRRLGAAYEVVDDCRHDLEAWLTWLRQRVGPKIGVIGHSLGAVKAIYALAHNPKLADAIVALSPPRLSYSWFLAGPQRDVFLSTYQRAEMLVNDGQPGALLDVQMPLPFVITAAGYVEKYGPDERYNFLKFLGSVRCPTLVTLGSNEIASNQAFAGLPEALKPLLDNLPQLRLEIVPGADHFYTGVRSALMDVTSSWLASAVS
jgi:pimeloyl-ACP methyl ester carboxylesterase